MERIHEDLPEKEFEMPATVKKVSICSETGLLARSSCDAVTEYYALSDVPTQRCSGHYVAPTPTATPTPDTSDTETPASTDDTENSENSSQDPSSADEQNAEQTPSEPDTSPADETPQEQPEQTPEESP